jgi:hypothetical protein
MLQIDDTIKSIAIKLAEANLNYRLQGNMEGSAFEEMIQWQNLLDRLCKAKAKEHIDSINKLEFNQ